MQIKCLTGSHTYALSIVSGSGEPRCGNYQLGIKNGQKYLFDRQRGCATLQCRVVLIYKYYASHSYYQWLFEE